MIGIALDRERQEQQNVRKLRGLDPERWRRLVDLIDRHGHQAPIGEVASLLGTEDDRQQIEALAARSNLTTVVRMLHDRTSQTLDMLLRTLSLGKLCVFDASQIRRGQALALSGIILKAIFDHNQDEFTKAEPTTIPTIAVVEEAQAVLNERLSAAEPYVAWVKEGRKYDLGAVLVTQQPGSIPTEILSQGDNWFMLHLLSAADLTNAQRANAHFSDDLLSVLLNEPIPGQGILWSSTSGKPYPVPLRVLSFERMIALHDKEYCLPATRTFATELQEELAARLEELVVAGAAEPGTANGAARGTGSADDPREPVDGPGFAGGEVDLLMATEAKAIAALRANQEFMTRIYEQGYPWGEIVRLLVEAMPPRNAGSRPPGVSSDQERSAGHRRAGERGVAHVSQPSDGQGLGQSGKTELASQRTLRTSTHGERARTSVSPTTRCRPGSGSSSPR